MSLRSRSKSWFLIGASILCAFANTLLTAQSVIQGSLTFENRFEGTTVHQDDLENFTLVALHRSFEQFPANSVLGVRFFVPRLDQTPPQKLFVEAAELQDTSQHYFMSSKPIRGYQANTFYTFTPWPTADVIDRLKINARNIGVLAGWQDADNRTVYSPVDVFRNPHTVTDSRYTFWFIVGRDVQTLELLVSNKQNQRVLRSLPAQTCNLTLDPDCTLYPASSTQAVSIDFETLPEGEYDVRFVEHYTRSDTFSIDVRIYHAPPGKGNQ